MPGAWRAPTLQTALGTDANPLVRCRCGRAQSADMMIDVRVLSAAVRERLEIPESTPALCDACCEALFRRGWITRVDFFAALGAPPTALERVRAYEARRARALGQAGRLDQPGAEA